MKKKETTHEIQTSQGMITITIGKTHKGTGYSGLSDGIEIIGTLTEFNRRLDSATLKDKEGRIHAIIPRTLQPCWIL